MLIFSTYQTDFVHTQARARRLQFSACHDYNLVLVFNSTFPTSDVLRLQLSKALPRIHILWYKIKVFGPLVSSLPVTHRHARLKLLVSLLALVLDCLSHPWSSLYCSSNTRRP